MNKKDYIIMLGLGIATFIFYAFFSNIMTVTNPVEVNYALSAKEMLLNHSFISPMIFGHAWYDKPPLTYWGLIASFATFGFTNFAARFPAIVTASLSVMAIFATTRVLTNRLLTAVWASIVLATTFEFWYISHAVITDGYLFLSSIGIFTFSYLAFTNNSKKYMQLAYASAGIAVLAKGPVGIVLPGAILLAFLAIRRQKSAFKILFNPLGIIIFFAIASPWYIAMYNIHGTAFIEGFLGLHNYLRATVSEHPEANVWYYYLALTPVYLLPWFGFTISKIIADFKSKVYKTDSLCQFQWLWAIIVILFYSIVATKYITYTFISLIPLIILTAQAITKFQDNPARQWIQWILSFASLIIFALVLMVGAVIEKHINPSLMLMIGSFTIIATLLSIRYTKLKQYPIIAAVCASFIFLALTPTIIPVLNIRSAEIYSKQVEAFHPTQVYYYHNYDTSYTYYTGKLPIRVIDPDRLPFDMWEAGKDVMPSTFLKDFEANNQVKPHSIFIVKVNLVKYFKQTEVSKKFHRIGNFDRFIFFANYVPQAKPQTSKVLKQ